MPDESEESMLGEGARALWGKARPVSSGAGSGWHSLACHMIDSAAAAGWLWDEFLSPGTKDFVDAVAADGPGGGRVLLRWLAALHDFGKATPSFQVRDEQRSAVLRQAGLPVEPNAAGGAPSHAHFSGLLLMDLLLGAGWERSAASWVALTLAGHHGVFPAANWRERRAYEWQSGAGPWAEARNQLLAMACFHAGLAEPGSVAVSAPDLPLQVMLAGAVVLADWLASNEGVFEYAGELQDGYPALAAASSAKIAGVLGLRDKWQPDQAAPEMGAAALFACRFGRDPRPVQEAACAVAAEGGRGLLLIEAPMGEGKTEAAFAAAEITAAASGADGLFIGLPSKATANQMYSRAVRWLATQPGVQVVTLAHGGARRHAEYRRLLAAGVGVDEADGGVAASRWLAGPKKALLAPVTVGTIDQLLLAGVSSRHVSLRHLGLSGKVVIVDEVHACDAYMSAILLRVLSWLGAARIPVILLSATLPATQRRQLLSAYAGSGVAGDGGADGYPRLSWVPCPAQVARRRSRTDGYGPLLVRERSPEAARSSRAAVTLIDERDAGIVPALAGELLSAGGCALVVRNTVRRAQDTYRELLKANDSADVTLIHARFTAADRRAREDKILTLFGPDGQRPARHITVGTQVLEQSLDCDFDVLLSDLAPIDLLLQRLGRVHRHSRPASSRGRLLQPQMYVAGREAVPGRPPHVPRGSSLVYSDHLLWRTEAVLSGLVALEIPRDVPRLVDQVYGPGSLGSPEWQPLMERAAEEATARQAQMEAQAAMIMLPQPPEASLASIHSRANVGDAVDEASAAVQAHVRIGPPTIEVMLLRAAGSGSAVTVSGGTQQQIPLGRDPSPAVTDIALDQLIRLPAQLTSAAAVAAAPVGAWARSPWLARVPVLFLPPDGGPLRLGRHTCSYSPDLGLEVTDA